MDGILIPIERKNGVTLYGTQINNQRKLGQYQVVHHLNSTNDFIYATYAEAEAKFKYLVSLYDQNKKK